MGKRVSNKKGKSRKSPARSLKTGARRRRKIAVKLERLAAARRRLELQETLKRNFGEL